MSLLVRALATQQVGLTLMVALLFQCCQRVDQGVPDQVERIVRTEGSTLVAANDFSDPYAQRKRWRVRVNATWAVYCEEVAQRFLVAGFRVETTDDSLSARKTTAGDSYFVEILSMQREGHVVQIDLTGTAF